MNIQNTLMTEQNALKQALSYFIINRCSFSGSTMSGGFSFEASEKRFTPSSVDRISRLDLEHFNISNQDFEPFVEDNLKQSAFIFLDPPYCLRSQLYGNNGDMQEKFDHNRLFHCISNKRNWMMTNNNCEYIKDLYRDFTIIETKWSYGMNKTKNSSEIVIIG